MAEWYCRPNGTSCNPAWLLIAKRAGCVAAMVSAVYDAVCEHANRQRPRGSVAEFDAASYAEFSGIDEDVIERILFELEQRRLIVDGRLRDAAILFPEKKVDRTNAERQARHKAKRRGEKVTTSNAVTSENRTGNAVTPQVTPLERESEALALVGNASIASSSCSVGNSESKSSSTRARALSVEQIEQKLQAAGAAGGMLAAIRYSGTVARWVEQGVTSDQLDKAVEIGRERRRAAGSNKPLNPGLLDSILSDLSAMPAAPAAGRPDPSPPRSESPLDQAIGFVKHLRHLGQIDEAEAEKRIQEARERHARSAA